MATSKAAEPEVLERALLIAARQAINSEGTSGEARKRLALIRKWCTEAKKELAEIRYGKGYAAPPAAERPSHD